jgi:hypothetical protein
LGRWPLGGRALGARLDWGVVLVVLGVVPWVVVVLEGVELDVAALAIAAPPPATAPVTASVVNRGASRIV